MKKLVFFLMNLVLVVLLINCSSPLPKQPQAGEILTVLPSTPSLSTNQVATKTATLTPTSPAATATSSPTPTRLPPTLTPTATPSPTAITYTQEEQVEIITKLLQNNGQCKFPCWWGITPGKTSWQTAHTFLSSLTSSINSNQSGSLNSVNFRELDETSIGPIASQQYTIEADLIETIALDAPQTNTYHIAQILTDYGPPDEIWVFANPNLPNGAAAFVLSLLYHNYSFMITYSYYHPTATDPILGCFSNMPEQTQLLLWSLEEKLTFQQAARYYWFGKDAIAYYHPLEDVTNMDINTFSQTFQQPNNTSCVETPFDFWDSGNLKIYVPPYKK